MYVVDGHLRWGATDLALATECEYALARRLDRARGRVMTPEIPRDSFGDHLATRGARHRRHVLEQLGEQREVHELPWATRPLTGHSVQTVVDATAEHLRASTGVLHRAALGDGEFFGYADFVEHSPRGWTVGAATIARSAKPKALLKLAVQAEQVRAVGVPVADGVALWLGNGDRVEVPLADLLPDLHERRERLRDLMAHHDGLSTPVAWRQQGWSSCGRCAECRASAEEYGDVLVVAGVRSEHRQAFEAAGISTIVALAEAPAAPEGLGEATFAKLQRQARLQAAAMSSETGEIPFELTEAAPKVLGRLPAPSPGDIFFDFEGDPLHEADDPEFDGLEYLWGLLDTAGVYTPVWAHSAPDEKAALEWFIDHVGAARLSDPGMHVFHYAPYEVNALKRLTRRYRTREDELATLLREEVFVDLYAVVKGAVALGLASYSIKQLEPLYMGEALRTSEVGDGAGSVVAYHQFRELSAAGSPVAAERLAALAEYNEYDCLSTRNLRDWLLERATEAGVEPRRRESEPSSAAVLPG